MFCIAEVLDNTASLALPEGLDFWLTIGCLIIALSAASVSLRVGLLARRLRCLSPAGEIQPDPVRLSVVIPARNEELSLADCVRSILAQGEVDLEVVIVDDHSTDETGRIADALAREDARVRVIHDPPLRPGWLGKPNAMQTGLETASASTVLFSDADIIHSPGCIAAALGEMQRRDLALLGLCPRFEFRGIWENTFVPAMISGMAFLLRGDLEDPRSDAAVAAGAFILVRRDSLSSIGGLHSIRREALDDIELARTFKKRGQPVGFYLATDLLRVRAFKGVREVFTNLAKNILAVVPGGGLLLVPLVIASTLSHWLPPFTFLRGLVVDDTYLVVSSLAAYWVAYLGALPFRRLAHYQPLLLLFYPLFPIPFIVTAVRALYHRIVLRSVVWRGRRIRIDASR